MRAVLSVVAALSCLSFAWAETPAGVEQLAWLEGRWEGESGGVSMEEQWT